AGADAAPARSGSSDVLRPEQADPYEVTADGDRLRVRFDIVDGYYLYREQVGLESGTPGATPGAAVLPHGQIHSYEVFSDEEIHRGALEIELPYTRSAGVGALDLTMRLQGCADLGLCYPPQTWTSRVDLPPAPAAGL